jgi:membrane protease YdiL (CAAX protease family)
MGDVLAMIPIMAVVLAVSLALLVLLAAIEGIGFDEFGSMETSELPPSMVVLPTMLQQVAWFGWPFVVSRWKGLGPASDWGWAFKPIDLGIGLGVAMIAMFLAGLGATITSALVGLEDESLAENTQIINDLEGSPWLWGLLFALVVGAPFSEELLFRGLILRSVAKRWGNVAGVVGSLLLFVPIHLADSGIGAGQVVLWVSIALLGLVLAVTAVVTERLAAPILAHMIINAIGAGGALGYLGGPGALLPIP